MMDATRGPQNVICYNINEEEHSHSDMASTYIDVKRDLLIK